MRINDPFEEHTSPEGSAIGRGDATGVAFGSRSRMKAWKLSSSNSAHGARSNGGCSMSRLGSMVSSFETCTLRSHSMSPYRFVCIEASSCDCERDIFDVRKWVAACYTLAAFTVAQLDIGGLGEGRRWPKRDVCSYAPP